MTTAVSKGTGLPSFRGSFKTYDDDLITKQFHAAKLTSTGIVDFCTAATDLVIGIIDNVPYEGTGYPVDVIMLGEAKAHIGSGGCAVGQFLVSDGTGNLVAAAIGTTTSYVAVGQALEDAEENDYARVFVHPCFMQV